MICLPRILFRPMSDRLSPDGNVARSFSYPLSPDLVREVFQIDDQETTTPEGCEIVYIPESMLDGQKCQDEIYMRVTTEVKRDSDSVGILRQWVIAGDEGEPIRGERSVEYSIGEKRVSPHNLEPNALIIMDTEDIGGLLDDIYEYRRLPGRWRTPPHSIAWLRWALRNPG